MNGLRLLVNRCLLAVLGAAMVVTAAWATVSGLRARGWAVPAWLPDSALVKDAASMLPTDLSRTGLSREESTVALLCGAIVLALWLVLQTRGRGARTVSLERGVRLRRVGLERWLRGQLTSSPGVRRARVRCVGRPLRAVRITVVLRSGGLPGQVIEGPLRPAVDLLRRALARPDLCVEVHVRGVRRQLRRAR
ncbi:hypothetical protein [Streptomyces sp. NPDC006879]|uniref:hypothetical protein n=1 Tax=Streptomyces sp. NPDC006879 TaxID=3364767 RepID=UPI0036D1140D